MIEKDLVEAYFAYLMSIKILEQWVHDMPKEGKELMMHLLQKNIKFYIELVTKHQNSPFEMKIKAIELKNFILENIIEEMIVLMARNGGMDEIIAVKICVIKLLDQELKDVKVKDMGDILILVAQDKFRIRNSEFLIREDILLKDRWLTARMVFNN